MESRMNITPQDVLYSLHTAQNQHDLDAMVACFALDLQSEQPVHPGLEFAGSDQVRKNWSIIFNSVPDIKSELLSSAIDGDTVWAEWRWYGHRLDGAAHDVRGVTILHVQNGQIARVKLYMEQVQAVHAGIDARIRSEYHVS